VNIIGSTINNNQAEDVRQLAIRIFSNLLPSMEGVSTKVPDCPGCSQGGGIYILSGNVNISSSTINNNEALHVRMPVP
jgi:hypothetical protein